MFAITVSDVALLFLPAFVLSLGTLWLMGRHRPLVRRMQGESRPRDVAFLFRDGVLVDHDASSLSLPDAATEVSDWSRFCGWMGFRFGDLPQHHDDIRAGQSIRLQAEDGATLALVHQGDSLRGVLHDTAPVDAAACHGS